MSDTEPVIILTKTPVPGQVKTRLLGQLAPQESADLAAAFLQDLVETLQLFVTADVRIALPTGDTVDPIRRILGEPGVRFLDQGPGDLGARLTHVTADAFAEGAARVTVVGSDHPNLPPELLSACRDAARDGSAGWIPTDDGGFAAMSLPRALPELFENVPWSTPDVTRTIRENARKAGATLVDAGTWYDIDTPDDLSRLAGELTRSGRCPATRRVLAALDPPLEARRSGGPGRS